MSKVLGAKQTIEKIRESDSRSVSNYVPHQILSEAVESPEFDVIVSEVRYDPTKLDDYFSPVGGGNVMPKTEIMYKIGEARGVRGIPEVSSSEPVYQEVDWSRLTTNDAAAPPELVRLMVGYKSRKQSWVLETDGSKRLSQVWEYTYNVWERSLEQWSENPGKYDTPAKRRAYFDREMKHAAQKAEYKAHSKTIRELAGMPTGYRKASLRDGWMSFYRVQLSIEAQEKDAAARRIGMATGGNDGGRAAVAALFGPEAAAALPEPEAPAASTAPAPQAAPRWLIAAETLAEYAAETKLSDENGKNLSALISTLQEKGDEVFDTPDWENVFAWFDYFEGPEGARRIDHGLARP
jgi:hypothetical protein